MDEKMPRSAEEPVSMVQAPLARAGASPHARRLGGREGAPGCCRLLHLGVLGTPVVALPR